MKQAAAPRRSPAPHMVVGPAFTQCSELFEMLFQEKHSYHSLRYFHRFCADQVLRAESRHCILPTVGLRVSDPLCTSVLIVCHLGSSVRCSQNCLQVRRSSGSTFILTAPILRHGAAMIAGQGQR